MRFDAGYYYGRGLSASDLAGELAAAWARDGVNLVYYYAYSRVYGARYRTSYPGNVMEDYGRQDLLGHMLREAHARNIRVIAWLYGPDHKQAWQAHPAWRERTADGNDYRPTPDSYPLCSRNPEVQAWWLGLIADLLAGYPKLDGLDIAEPQVATWGDEACHCEHCRRVAAARPEAAPASAAWRKLRADGLTELLLATSRLVRGRGKEMHLTTVFTARPDGSLMSPREIRDATGFDLEAILASPDRPDAIQAELIWQQWAAAYQRTTAFTPEWTRRAVREAKGLVRGRARLIAHLEVTGFERGPLDAATLARTVRAATLGGPDGVDLYDAYQLERTADAGRHLQMAWLAQ